MHSNSPEPELLKSILEPLLEDFLYWFSNSRTLLETETLEFLGAQGQAELLARVKEAQSQATIVQALVQATDAKAGVETAVLMSWHQLVSECWQAALLFRARQTTA